MSEVKAPASLRALQKLKPPADAAAGSGDGEPASAEEEGTTAGVEAPPAAAPGSGSEPAEEAGGVVG